MITPRHDYYPLTPHAQAQIPWFLRRWVTPREPPGKNVVSIFDEKYVNKMPLLIQNVWCSSFCFYNYLESLQVLDYAFQVLTVGALHQADSAALRSAASAWHDELALLPKPLLVVNIGGPSSKVLDPELVIVFILFKLQTYVRHPCGRPDRDYTCGRIRTF